jgi:hypothetical protein
MFSSLGAPEIPVTPHGVLGDVVEDISGRSVLAGSPPFGIGGKFAVVTFGRRKTCVKGNADFSVVKVQR